jgi:hypothetical protein
LIGRIGPVRALHLELGALLFEARSFAHELHALLEVTLLHELLAFLHQLLSGLHEVLANLLKLLILLTGATALVVIVMMMMVVVSAKGGHEVSRLLPGQAKLVHRTDLQTRLHAYGG